MDDDDCDWTPEQWHEAAVRLGRQGGKKGGPRSPVALGLTAAQARFLAARQTAATDADAAAAAGIAKITVYTWRLRDAKFRDAYNASFLDAIEAAKMRLRDYLCAAVDVIAETMTSAMTASGAIDYPTRLAAAVKILQTHGIITERRTIAGDPQAPVRVTIELVDSTGPRRGVVVESVARELAAPIEDGDSGEDEGVVRELAAPIEDGDDSGDGVASYIIEQNRVW